MKPVLFAALAAVFLSTMPAAAETVTVTGMDPDAKVGITYNGVPYGVAVSPGTSSQVWIYGPGYVSHSLDNGTSVSEGFAATDVAKLCVTDAPAGSVIKLATCVNTDKAIDMRIGQTAFAEMGDGTVLQLKLRDVGAEDSGDTENTATFEVEAYAAGTPMVEVF